MFSRNIEVIAITSTHDASTYTIFAPQFYKTG